VGKKKKNRKILEGKEGFSQAQGKARAINWMCLAHNAPRRCVNLERREKGGGKVMKGLIKIRALLRKGKIISTFKGPKKGGKGLTKGASLKSTRPASEGQGFVTDHEPWD